MSINLVIAFSQQHNNKCKEGDTETDHMYTIAKALYDLISPDKRFNTYLIPKLNLGSDKANLNESIRLSNEFIKKNGSGYHIEIHSDGGAYATGASGLYVSEAGKAFLTPIMNELMNLTPTADVGMRKRTDLGALNETHAVAGIVEVSFHDNEQEAQWIHDNIQTIAHKLRDGIYKYFGLEVKTVYKKIWLTHVIELDPMNLKAALVKESGRKLTGRFKNFINGNFFSYNTMKPIGWLISEGKVLNDRHEYKIWKGNPKGTLIVYKDGRVEVGLKLDSEMVAIKDIWFCCQGFNLSPLDILKEGFNPDEVGYSTKRLAIGYRKKDNKIVIAARPYSDSKRAVKTMKNLGCDGAICLDSGGSTNMVCNGKGLMLTDRTLANIIYW